MCLHRVVLLSDPPDMKHKSGRQLHDNTEILGRGCQECCVPVALRCCLDRSEYEDTKYGTIRKASFDLNIITPNEFLFCKAEK